MRRVLIIMLVATACSSSSGDTAATQPVETPSTSRASTQPTDGSTATTQPDQAGTRRTTAPTTTAPTRPATTGASATTVPTTTSADNNTAPTVTISTPADLTLHAAEFDTELNWFAANVALSAEASDADGDGVTIEWFSDVGGPLGTGPTITAALQPLSDSTIHNITAVATDANGATSTTSITIIVWIPSS